MNKRLLVVILVLVLAMTSLTGCFFVRVDKGAQVTITFDTNGGSAVPSIVAKPGDIIHAPLPPTRDDYEFLGWHRDVELTIPYVFGVMPDEDMTLYAKWKLSGYTVTLNGNGGTGAELTLYRSGEETPLPNDWTREGYIFAGWYETADFSTNRVLSIASTSQGDKVYYAKWVLDEPGKYLVTLNGNGGTGDALDSYKVGEGATLPTWTREGCTFDGWYDNVEMTGFPVTKIGKLDKGDKVYYAKWTPKNYTITFESNGGSAVDDMTVPYGSTIEEPIPAYTDKVFDGWYEDKALTGERYSFSTMPAKNITLYARWVEGFTLTYMSEGVVVKEDILAKENVVLIDPVAYSFNRPDYYFDGWYSDSLYTKKCASTMLMDRSRTLYAKWTHRSFLPYLDEFRASVNEHSPAVIESDREFLAYIDYINVMSKNGEDNFFVKMPYLNGGSFETAINNAIEKSTTYIPGKISFTPTGNPLRITLEKDRKLDHFVPVPNQSAGLAQKAYHGLKPDYTPLRENIFDSFGYETYGDSLEVTTSDQLFYALQYGIKPLPVVGSSADKLLDKAKSILRGICDDSMTDIEKLYSIFSWMIENVHYDHAAVDIASIEGSNPTQYDAWHLEGVLNNNAAVCDGISKAVTVLARIEGIPCIRVTSNPIIGVVEGHAWNKVYVDVDGNGVKEWYNFDATWGNVSVKFNGNAVYEMGDTENFLFKDGDKGFEKPRIPANQLDIKATTDVDVFKALDFDYDGKVYDFYIDDQADANAVMRYLHDVINTKPLPSECRYISLSVGGVSKISVENMLKSAMNKANNMNFIDKDFKSISSTTSDKSMLFIFGI